MENLSKAAADARMVRGESGSMGDGGAAGAPPPMSPPKNPPADGPMGVTPLS